MTMEGDVIGRGDSGVGRGLAPPVPGRELRSAAAYRYWWLAVLLLGLGGWALVLGMVRLIAAL
ncbi:MAG TPA: hypothetical protein VFA22_07830 [Stellaceae bacterium]|nr:hypothetical protein [Stellaceae bacterium]